jgi:hypothetical protein
MSTPRKPFRALLRRCAVSASLLTPASFFLAVSAQAQVSNARLSGTVTDASGAVIPGAQITLVNDLNKDTRTAQSNGTGLFSFSGLPSGNYTISIDAPGFQHYSESGIHLDPGDSRSLPKLSLTTGAESQTVTVTATQNIPLDTGERSDLITAEEIKHLSVEGRDVTELFKTLPGFAIANQGVNNAAYDPSQVNVSGALGNYAANGNPLSGISLMLDGANITDPGNYGAAIQNVNYDQVAEVKVQVSNFGADIANGPVVVNAVTTAGGDHYHGELYTYARTYQLDSTDWLSGATGQPKAPDREVYPGFNVGGPVLIPKTGFNHNRKLTFFAGAEDYAQRNIYAYGNSAGAIVHALVPTAGMRAGNFSSAELGRYLGPLATNAAFVNVATQPTIAPNGAAIINGQIPLAFRDPGFQALYKAMPLPNVPTNATGQYNWVTTNFVNNDLWEAIGRVDLAISDRNKLFGRYTVERGAQGVPEVPYYSPGQLNTPGGLLSKINSESAAAALTSVLTNTLTNELFGSFAYMNQGFAAGNQSALNASSLGYPYKGAYAANGSTEIPQFQTYCTGCGLPLGLFPDTSYGPIFAHKFDPVGGDNLTKVWGNHTAVFGTYVERVTNNQRIPFGTTNGALQQYYMQTSTIAAPNPITDADGTHADLSENYAANNYEGYTGTYSQQNILPDTNLYFWNVDWFATDSWKVVPTLTLNFGVRVEHLGLWNDAHGNGVAVFEPSTLTSTTLPQPGFLWHSIDHSLPLSGVNSAVAYVEPRVGFAWDMTGKGTTVLRGGFGEYRTHDSWNDASNAVTATEDLRSTTIAGNGGTSLRAVSSQNLATNAGVLNGSTYGMTPGDNEQPTTDTYSFTINQQLPWKITGLIGYVGNNSRYILNDGSNSGVVNLDNVNSIPMGALFRPNPVTGQVLTLTGTGNGTINGAPTNTTNQYRPYYTPNTQYGQILVPKHNLYSNYNGLQLAAARQAGRILFTANYTFSKALGIFGGYSNGNPIDPFHLYLNYGPESYDRTHILNTTYTFMVGRAVQNRWIGGAVNGWELSGISTFQSGPNLQATNGNPGFGLYGAIGPVGPTQLQVNNKTFLGTPDVNLQPVLTCSPRSHLGRSQFIKGSCFALPNIGQNGQAIFPYLHGPAYFDSDLSAQKSFSLPREEDIVLRFSAFNFINHPLTSFTGNFTNEYTLNIADTAAGASVQSARYDPSTRFGFADYKEGRRVVEMMLKYTF